MLKKRRIRRSYKGPLKWVQYVLARGLIGLLRSFPIDLNYRLGRMLGWAGWKLMSERRRTVTRNLKIIQTHMRSVEGLPALEEPIEEQVKQVFLHAGVNLLCGFSLGRMKPDAMLERVEVVGLELLTELIAQGKGVIIVMTHMGPWEALPNMNRYYASMGVEVPFGAVYRRFNNDYVDKWFVQEREASGTRMFASQHNFYAPTDFVREGGVLGILSDQRATRGETIEFFGQRVQGTPLPGLLHRRAKAPMIAISFCTVGRARWKIEFSSMEFVADQPDVGRKEFAEICGRAAERCLSESIYDGFWFHNRFR